MEKRYQVFVSSTYIDLSDERLEVIKALLELDCFPCGMEYFPAAAEESWSYIASLIDQCDYYVVIVGGRYGSLTTEGISFTQKEYLYALSKGIPTIAFLHSTPEDLPAKKTEPSIEGKKKLADFVAQLRQHICKDWTTSHELGAVVSRSLTQLIKRHPRTGWIPANQESDPKATKELLELTKKVRELESELQKARGKRTVDVSNLADGDEPVELGINFVVSKEAKRGGWNQNVIVHRSLSTIKICWNDIFRAIAPRIAPFANDSNIRAGINAILKDRFQPPIDAVEPEHWVSNVTLTDEAYNTVKIQFSALGLITAEKERQDDGSMTGVLWRLTERGQSRLLQSLAVHSKRLKAKDKDSEALNEPVEL